MPKTLNLIIDERRLNRQSYLSSWLQRTNGSTSCIVYESPFQTWFVCQNMYVQVIIRYTNTVHGYIQDCIGITKMRENTNLNKNWNVSVI